MTDIETRLRELEKRIKKNEENLQILNARTKAHSMIFTAIGVPVCAISPHLSETIIDNLRNVEKVARKMNGSGALIRAFREVRESFERLVKSQGSSSS